MTNLKNWQNKIKEKRQNTPFRDFLKEIVSWHPIVLQKNSWMVSKYPQTQRVKKVINFEKFHENRDNLLEKWIDYNFWVKFFENYKSLWDSIELFNLVNYWWTENSQFSDMALNSKNVYMSSAVIGNCENILYSLSVKQNCSDVYDSMATREDSNNIYFCSWVQKSYKIFYSRFINNSNNIRFSSNLNWCTECIMCNDLDNCSYYIKNKKYKKEQYLEEKQKILKSKTEFLNFHKEIDKIWKNINSQNTTWSSVFNSENVKSSYYSYNAKDSNNIMFAWGVDWVENLFDTFLAWTPSWREFYWTIAVNGDGIYSSISIIAGMNIYYSLFLNDCSHCIWCIWLQNKSYCILNKQYSKEQWEHLANKIFAQMEEDWILWDFFPWELNPFYFNDTMAWLLWNFSKQEVEKEGYMWRDEEIKVDIPEWLEIIESKDLQNFQWFDKNWNWQINPEILKKVIKDERWNYYRIVKMEYDFLVKHWLPLPEIHWMDRMKLNFGI